MPEKSSRFSHTVIPVIILIILLAVLPFASGVIPVLRFTKERIEVYVKGGSVEVIAYYCYENPHPVPVIQGMRVPFPVDSAHPGPWKISIERVEASGEAARPLCDGVVGAGEAGPIEETPGAFTFGAVDWRFSSSGDALFSLWLASKEKAVIKVVYAQEALENNASYILVTTKPWGAPLEHGVYRLYQRGISVVSSNYSLRQYGRDVLGFEKAEFMPEEDWRFEWSSGALAHK
ncbi:MAG: hypothetical protein OEV59_01705 [Deltaproteobacteria bacterium]|nr:hypothetical protein [Deltaproteobacteria bacterium]